MPLFDPSYSKNLISFDTEMGDLHQRLFYEVHDMKLWIRDTSNPQSGGGWYLKIKLNRQKCTATGDFLCMVSRILAEIVGIARSKMRHDDHVTVQATYCKLLHNDMGRYSTFIGPIPKDRLTTELLRDQLRREHVHLTREIELQFSYAPEHVEYDDNMQQEIPMEE